MPRFLLLCVLAVSCVGSPVHRTSTTTASRAPSQTTTGICLSSMSACPSATLGCDGAAGASEGMRGDGHALPDRMTSGIYYGQTRISRRDVRPMASLWGGGETSFPSRRASTELTLRTSDRLTGSGDLNVANAGTAHADRAGESIPTREYRPTEWPLRAPALPPPSFNLSAMSQDNPRRLRYARGGNTQMLSLIIATASCSRRQTVLKGHRL